MKPARHFEDLIVWQLNDAIRTHTLALTQTGRFGRDWKLRWQLEDAAHSVCRNISEGFGSASNREFARFLVISRRSMNEVQDCLRGAELAKYVSLDDLRPIRALQRRAFKALSGLLSWLERHPDRPMRQRGTTASGDNARPNQRKKRRTNDR